MSFKTVTIGPCTLIHGDCLEVLPTLRGVDAVVTDPPYGFGAYATDAAVSITPLLGLAQTVAVFGYPETIVGWCVECGAVPDEWITWWPTNAIVGRAAGLQREVEAIAVFGSTPGAEEIMVPRSKASERIARKYKSCKNVTHRRSGDVWRDAKPGMAFQHESRQHPNEKPVSLMEKLTVMCAKPESVVLDPFMGSGTTGVACIKTGRQFIGIELEQKYFDIACERIRKAWKLERSKLPLEPQTRFVQQELTGV